MAAVSPPANDDEEEEGEEAQGRAVGGGVAQAEQDPLTIPVVMVAKEHGEAVRMVQSRVERYNERVQAEARTGGSGGERDDGGEGGEGRRGDGDSAVPGDARQWLG